MSEQSNNPVRVRFAPSPTGYLHVGGARTALFNALYAKRNGGQFILRIEDTDQARSTENSLRMQVEDLVWLGLKWDEGPDPITLQDIGPYGPYRQSQRLNIYKKYAEQLVAEDKAYYCFMTDEELEAQRPDYGQTPGQQQVQNQGPFKSPYRDWPLAKAQSEMLAKGQKAVIRFKNTYSKPEYVLQDLIRGEVRFPSDMVGDFVLLRSDGMPVYNFCCVVDDALMKITHVLRAEEHLSNTPKQMMLYEALGFALPRFGHMSLVLGEDKQKLSKRHGATSCHEFQERGYLPEALRNFIALLGWSHPGGKEVMDLAELSQEFSVERLNPAPAVFDDKKLLWMNSVYLRALDPKTFWIHFEKFAKDLEIPLEFDWKARAFNGLKHTFETFAQGVEVFKNLSQPHFEISAEEAGEVYAWPSTKSVLEAWCKELEEVEATKPAGGSPFLDEARFHQIQDQVKNKTGAKGKFLFMAIRVAVIGKPHGTDLKLLVPLIEVKNLILRAKLALEKCQP